MKKKNPILTTMVVILVVLFLFGIFSSEEPASDSRNSSPYGESTISQSLTPAPLPTEMLPVFPTIKYPEKTNPGTSPAEQETVINTVPVIGSEPTKNTEQAVPSSLEVHFLNVGQGDAALLICGEYTMLIDGGDPSQSSLIYSYLKARKIDHLDYIISTHCHADHCGGLSGALNYAKASKAFSPYTEYEGDAFSDFVRHLNKQNIPVTVPSCGDSFYLGDAFCQFIGPVAKSDEHNNESLILMVSHGDVRILFAGDAEYPEETSVLNSGADIKCDLLKAGHHGSSDATGYRWLREADPDYAVISCGAGNSYGHPHEATLSRFRDAQVKLFRTDMQGHIIATSDGKTLSFQVQKNRDADTLSQPGDFQNPDPPVAPDRNQTGQTGQTEPEGTTYVCNTNTKKFHYPGCSSVSQMSEKNKKYVTATRDELIRQGYDPCGRCDP